MCATVQTGSSGSRTLAAPQMRIEERTASTPVTSDEVKLRVQSLRVTGSTAFTEPALVELTGFVARSELTLSQLQAMAEKITGLYRRNGYFGAHAYVSAQEIKDGAVHVAVSEGRYGAITLRNNTNLREHQQLTMAIEFVLHAQPRQPIGVARALPSKARLLMAASVVAGTRRKARHYISSR